MGLQKQAKVLSKKQIGFISETLHSSRNGLRNQTVFLLSVKAGLRAKEISSLTWEMVTDSDGKICDRISLTDVASKGKSGREIPLHNDLKANLSLMLVGARKKRGFSGDSHVIVSERSDSVSAQTIVNMFFTWYRDLGLQGASSHSGRRTFITNCARQISTVGGSLRDIQYLAGHSSLQTTQRYIDGDSAARMKVVNLL